MCGCVYHHPDTDVENFLGYIESTLSRSDKSKYHVFLMGDFNIDLLQYESHSHTNDFINSIFLILFCQTFINQQGSQNIQQTIIDNIFSDITDHETLSGNITSLIADHFAQFLLIKKCHVSYESCSYFVHDYSSFGEEKFMIFHC